MAERDDDEIGTRRPRWPEQRSKPAIAVALKYKNRQGVADPKRAPRVTASGKGAVAEQILEIAFAKGIPVREDPDLAEILATVDIDSEIPVDALSAVAEILSYLYRANAKPVSDDADSIEETKDDRGA
jgi:flagellar biosynthesis protein